GAGPVAHRQALSGALDARARRSPPSVAEPAPAYGAHTAAVADNPPGAGQYCPMGAPSADTPQGCPRPAPAGRRPDCTGGRHSGRRPEYLGPDPAGPLAVSGRRRLAGTAPLTDPFRHDHDRYTHRDQLA